MTDFIVSVVLVSILLIGSACTSYKQIELARVSTHDNVRVITRDGSELLLTNLSVEADSLRGYPEHDTTQVAVPLEQVVEVQAKQADALRTVGLVALIALAVGSVVLLGAVIAFAASDF